MSIAGQNFKTLDLMLNNNYTISDSSLIYDEIGSASNDWAFDRYANHFEVFSCFLAT